MDESEGRLTRTRQFVGTLRYASPEQLNGLALDPRADVYSLGATLWELLTLRPLYGVTDQTPTPEQINTLLVKADPEKERVRRYNRRVPADLDAIVLKCLRKDPADRYPTAAELAEDLGRWERGEPVRAQPPSLGYLLRKQVHRYRVPLGVAAGVLVAAAAGLAVAFWQIRQARDDVVAALGRETAAKELADWQKEEAERLRATADHLLAASKGQAEHLADALRTQKVSLAELERQIAMLARNYAARAEVEYGRGNWSAALNWMLRAYTEAPANDPLRASYRQLLAGWARPPGSPIGLGPQLVDAAVSPDERLIAAVDAEGAVWVLKLGSGEVVDRLRLEHRAEAVGFTPDGRSLLVGARDGDRNTSVTALDTDSFLIRYRTSAGSFPLQIAPDGSQLAGIATEPEFEPRPAWKRPSQKLVVWVGVTQSPLSGW